jgi:hypothetical protein
MSEAEKQLKTFIDKFEPQMQARIRAARMAMRKRLPTAFELVYDNYNFFVIGYGPTERPSDALLSLACQAGGIALCFLNGAKLPDPKKVLKGSGRKVRSIKLPSVDVLDQPEVKALLKAAIAAAPPFPRTGNVQLVIRSVSAKQRPRRKVTP